MSAPGRVVYLDGRWVDEDRAAISIHDRGFLFGDGIYESVRLHRGAYFRYDLHYDRLAAGAAILRIDVPPRGELRDVARELARRNDLAEGSLRITITRGRGGRGLSTVGAGPATVLLTLRAIAAEQARQAARGWNVITARTPHPPPSAFPPQLKAQNRLFAVLARLEADAAGADDVLLLSTEGYVAEGSTWNVFWRTGDRLFTPSLDVGILAGVTRATLVELIAELDVSLLEGRWPRAELDRADEVFASLSSAGVVSFRSLDGRVLPPENRTLAALLHRRYWDRVDAEIAGEHPTAG